jgi:translation initiation factor IF-2
MLHLVAEVQELWADPNAELAGIIVEARLDQSQGPVATVLLRNGRLSVGDVVVCGTAHGRVRRLRNWLGKTIKASEPGHPVEVIGLSDVPESGDLMIRVDSPKEARQLAEQNDLVLRGRQLIGAQGAALRELYNTLQGGQIKDLNVIIKADAYGSAQALESSLTQLNDELEEVKINVIHTGVGAITESDVLLATASKAIVVGFHVVADQAVLQAAASEGVEVRTYRIIYQALDDFRAAAFGMLEPIVETRYLGKAEVLQIFRISRVGVVAGSRVLEGELRPNADIVVTRDREEVYSGKLTSLRHFNQDVSLVQAGSECGLASSDFRGWKIGDQVAATMQVTVERKLQPTS